MLQRNYVQKLHLHQMFQLLVALKLVFTKCHKILGPILLSLTAVTPLAEENCSDLWGCSVRSESGPSPCPCSSLPNHILRSFTEPALLAGLWAPCGVPASGLVPPVGSQAVTAGHRCWGRFCHHSTGLAIRARGLRYFCTLHIRSLLLAADNGVCIILKQPSSLLQNLLQKSN